MTTVLSAALATVLLFLAFLFGVALFLCALFCLCMAIQTTGKLSPEEAEQQAAPHICECEHCTGLRQRSAQVDLFRG